MLNCSSIFLLPLFFPWDYPTKKSVSQDSNLVIVTAGAAQLPGESRLNLLERNVSIIRSVIPPVLAFSPNAAICVVANPCDIMTAVACKVAGPAIPAGRIFGSGTCLDSSRLRSLISTRMNLDASSVQGYILGEHGDSSVPVWSSVKIGGLSLVPYGHDPDEIHDEMHREVVNSAYEVIEKKGSTNWAIGTGRFG
jgi:L-lactate dehydrogenase